MSLGQWTNHDVVAADVLLQTLRREYVQSNMISFAHFAQAARLRNIVHAAGSSEALRASLDPYSDSSFCQCGVSCLARRLAK